MIRKLILGLAAVATIGAAALAPTAASAGGFFHHHHRGVFLLAPAPVFVGPPIVTRSCLEKRLVPTRRGLRWRIVNVCAF